jgi:hypothetical protein
LREEDLIRILATTTPLPLARAATIDEAELVQRRLDLLGIDSTIMPEAAPGSDAAGTVKVRALEIDDDGIFAYKTPEEPFVQISWSDMELLVVGRLIVKRIELKERKARSENSILDSSEFVTDETIADFYVREQTTPYRIATNSFDFSCLGVSKGLLAGENISKLLQLFREKSPQAVYDDSFNSLRKSLEPVWPSEQQNESSGWRRDGPGKISLGSVMERNNEMQFSRYSRLRHHLLTVPAAPSDQKDHASRQLGDN